jgi:uridine phosphorylase
MNTLRSSEDIEVFTASAPRFYGPQVRIVKLALLDSQLNNRISNFNGIVITNLEMETSAIYGLSKLMGYEIISMNAIIENRYPDEFSTNLKETSHSLIKYTLDKLV